MIRALSVAALILVVAAPASAEEKYEVLYSIGSLKSETSTIHAVITASDGRLLMLEASRPSDLWISRVAVLAGNGLANNIAADIPFSAELVSYQNLFFAATEHGIIKLDKQGKPEPFAPPNAFPFPFARIDALTVDPESGTLYAIAISEDEPPRSFLCRVTPQKQVEIISRHVAEPRERHFSALAMDGASHLLIADGKLGDLQRLKLADGSRELVSAEIDKIERIAIDPFGRIFVARQVGSEGTCQICAIPRPGEKPTVIATGLSPISGMCVEPGGGRNLIVAEMGAGRIIKIPIKIPGFEIDDSPLPIETARAFPDLKFAGWSDAAETGKVVPLRPIDLRHANDGTNRLFVATEQGVIHVFPNDQAAKQSKVFLNIEKQVVYNDNQNEEGVLGLAFHPSFKKNGEFFVFYTTKKSPRTNVVSRFKVSQDNPDQADPASEEEILRIENRPFWNHDGGSLCFGPDGYLYVSVGDGGLGNDPYDNAQNLSSLMGKILRIDVNHQEGGKPYAIPNANPFIGRDKARPEIWAYGLRNVWRMAFDRETDLLFAADVGQNLFEEIDLIEKGGNYGWNRREGLHPFGAQGVGSKADLIDPIWEYHHDLGRSITGGVVYRGKKFPELRGAYIYADYVSGRIWALRYDATQKRVVANQPILDQKIQFISFGEDAEGEIYGLTVSATGKGIYRFVHSTEAK